MVTPLSAQAQRERRDARISRGRTVHLRKRRARVTTVTGFTSDFADILRSYLAVSTLVLDLKNGKPVERRGRKATGLTDCP